MCNFLSTLRLGVSPSYFNKKSDEFGQLFNATLLKQKKEDEAVLSLFLHRDHAEDLNLSGSSVMQVSNVQSGNPAVVPGSHVVCSPTSQTCETASSTLLGSLSSTQLTPPSNVTNPPVVAGNDVVTGATFHTCSAGSVNPHGSLSQATPSSDLANQPVIAYNEMVTGTTFHTCPSVAAIRCEDLNTDTSVIESGNTGGNVTENEIGPGWKIAFDNLDIFQRVREMTEDNQNKDHHWINHVKVTNRVSGNHLPDDNPLCESVMELDNYKVIPTGPDHISQRGNYIRLMERVLTEEIPYLSFCKDVVTSHIPHRHAKQMSAKSEKVRIVICLPFIFYIIIQFSYTVQIPIF